MQAIKKITMYCEIAMSVRKKNPKKSASVNRTITSHQMRYSEERPMQGAYSCRPHNRYLMNYVPFVLQLAVVGVNVAALVSRKQNVVGLSNTQIISININSLFHLSLVPFGVPPLRSLSLQSSPRIRSYGSPHSPVPSLYPFTHSPLHAPLSPVPSPHAFPHSPFSSSLFPPPPVPNLRYNIQLGLPSYSNIK